MLRDEGEAYARKLCDAGVRVTSVRYNATMHDFIVMNALADTPATRGAIAQAIGALKALRFEQPVSAARVPRPWRAG